MVPKRADWRQDHLSRCGMGYSGNDSEWCEVRQMIRVNDSKPSTMFEASELVWMTEY